MECWKICSYELGRYYIRIWKKNGIGTVGITIDGIVEKYLENWGPLSQSSAAFPIEPHYQSTFHSLGVLKLCFTPIPSSEHHRDVVVRNLVTSKREAPRAKKK